MGIAPLDNFVLFNNLITRLRVILDSNRVCTIMKPSYSDNDDNDPFELTDSEDEEVFDAEQVFLKASF